MDRNKGEITNSKKVTPTEVSVTFYSVPSGLEQFKLCYLSLIGRVAETTPCSIEAFSRAINTHSNLRLLRF